ncbi:helix-turn-helix domain-containing protein [Actinophytocola xinjiangensis]|nr:helix-turn-helix domain-containing protein [Actinophytocola xinjiangensis]
MGQSPELARADGDTATGPGPIATRAEFGARLTGLRDRERLSINAVAGRTGIPRSTVADWCRAHRLPHAGQHTQFESMLRVLGVEDTGPWLTALARIRAGTPRPEPGAPYPGLASFRMADAEWFFGRAELTRQAVARCHDALSSPDRPAVLVVVGPSGAGKSSLIHAGLCPELTGSGFACVSLTPGATPLRRLDDHLAAAQGRPVVVVDQLEELFTECADPRERERFLDRLVALADGPVEDRTLVVLGLRVDFYARAAAHRSLARALERSQLVVGALTRDELVDAVVEPARRAGFSVDEDLLAMVLNDFVPSGAVTGLHDAGALPLLSHALRETWRRARRQRMRAADYLAAGGIDGAIAQTAEEVHDGLDAAARDVARQVFLRLVRVDGDGDGDGPVTRHEARLSELTGIGGRDVVALFVAARLLTAKADTVEITHEALVVAWPRVRSWISGAREQLRLHAQVRQAARYWIDSGHDGAALLRGGRLAALRVLLEDSAPSLELSADERAFLLAGIAAERHSEVDRRRRDRRRHQLSAGVIALVVVVVGAIVVAVQTRAAADRVERLARSGDIAGKAERLREHSPELAAQLGLVAYRVDPTVEARSVLLDATAQPLATRQVDERRPADLVVPVGDLLAVATENGGVLLRDRSGASPPVTVVAEGGEAVTAIAASGTRLAVVTERGALRLWDLRDPATVPPPVELSTRAVDVSALAFAPDGRTLAAGGDRQGEPGTVTLWPLTGPAREPVRLTGPTMGVTDVAFAPDGATLVAASRDRRVYRYRLAGSGAPVALPPLAGPDGQVHAVAYAPDGRTVAGGVAADHAVYLWDVTDPRGPRLVAKLDQPKSWVNAVRYSPDGRRIVAASGDGKLWVWDAGTHRVLGTFAHPVAVESVDHVDGRTMVTVAGDGVVRTWTMDGPVYTDTLDAVFTVAFTGSGDTLLAVPNLHDNRLHLLDAASQARLSRVRTLTHSGRFDGLSATGVFSPDGRYLAAGARYGGLYVWDLAASPPVEIGAAQVAQDGLTWLDHHPTRPLLVASAGNDAAVVVDLSDPRRPRSLARLDDTDARLNEARFSPDGSLLVTADAEGGVRLYRVDDPSRPSLAGTVTVDSAMSPVFDPRGRLLAVGSGDGRVHLWDVSDPSRPRAVGQPLDGPVSDVWQIAFHPDGTRLAAASTDESVYVWDVADPAEPRPFAVLRATTDSVRSVSFAPTGDTLVAGAGDGSVRRWITDPDAAARWICATVGTPITPTEWTRLLPDLPYTPPCG